MLFVLCGWRIPYVPSVVWALPYSCYTYPKFDWNALPQMDIAVPLSAPNIVHTRVQGNGIASVVVDFPQFRLTRLAISFPCTRVHICHKGGRISKIQGNVQSFCHKYQIAEKQPSATWVPSIDDEAPYRTCHIILSIKNLGKSVRSIAARALSSASLSP